MRTEPASVLDDLVLPPADAAIPVSISGVRNVEAARPASRADTYSLAAVNGWRGPGALAICVAHFASSTGVLPDYGLEPIALVVDLFFVFSGLVIAKVYTERLSDPAVIPEYLLRRVGRIWPLQAATLAVLIAYELLKLILATKGVHFSSPPFSSNGLNIASAIPTNLFLIHALGLHDRETWNFPSWSLSVEFVTYGLFAVYCLIKPAARPFIALALIALCMVVLMIVAPYHMRSTYDFGIFRCVAGFLVGTLCFDILKKWPLPLWPSPTLVEIAAVAALLAWMIRWHNEYPVYLAPLVFCVFVLIFAAQRGALSRILAAPPLQKLAELSFAIYMVHALVLIAALILLHALERIFGVTLFFAAEHPLNGLHGPTTTIQVFHSDSIVLKWCLAGGYTAVVLAVAIAAYRFVEVPGRQFFGRLAKATANRRASADVVESRGHA